MPKMNVIYAGGYFERQAKQIILQGTKTAISKGYVKQIHTTINGENNLEVIKKPIDIYHCHSCYSLNGILKAKKLGAKIVLQRDSSHVIPLVKIMEDEEDRWRNTEYKFLCDNKTRERSKIDYQISEYDNADYILLASTFERDSFLSQGYKRKKLKIIPFTADSKVFYPRNYKHDFSVLLGGNMHLRKGYPYAKEATKKVGIPLNVMEGIPFEKVPNELNQHSVVLAPTAEDGYPHQVLSSMLCGLVPILSNNNGVKDLIKDGKNGFIVDITDKEEAITKIAEILTNLKDNPEECKEMGLKARKAVEKWTWKNYSDEIAKFYEKIYKRS